MTVNLHTHGSRSIISTNYASKNSGKNYTCIEHAWIFVYSHAPKTVKCLSYSIYTLTGVVNTLWWVLSSIREAIWRFCANNLLFCIINLNICRFQYTLGIRNQSLMNTKEMISHQYISILSKIIC